MEHVGTIVDRVMREIARRSGRDARALGATVDQLVDLGARQVERRRERVAHLGVSPITVERHRHLLWVQTVRLREPLDRPVPRLDQRPELVRPRQVPREAVVNHESVAHSYPPTVPWEGFKLTVVSTTSNYSLSTVNSDVKGDVYPRMPQSDRSLIEALIEVLRERNLSQNRAAQRMGVAQSTLSRLIRTVKAGQDPEELRPWTREAIKQFITASAASVDERAVAIGRQIAANLLEEIAELLRRGADQAPDGEILPPTLRRLLGAGSTGSDRDAERRAALEDLLDDLGRQADEDPERRERA